MKHFNNFRGTNWRPLLPLQDNKSIWIHSQPIFKSISSFLILQVYNYFRTKCCTNIQSDLPTLHMFFTYQDNVYHESKMINIWNTNKENIVWSWKKRGVLQMYSQQVFECLDVIIILQESRHDLWNCLKL